MLVVDQIDHFDKKAVTLSRAIRVLELKTTPAVSASSQISSPSSSSDDRWSQRFWKELSSFNQRAAPDRSVFIMMKFSAAGMSETHIRLHDDIYETIATELIRYGLLARRADARTFHEQLWENVCIYMLGCSYGIAVLEDRVANEFNPNIAVEYGFMMALHRNVALLREISFRHDRADLLGKITIGFRVREHDVLDRASLATALENCMLDWDVRPLQRPHPGSRRHDCSQCAART